MKKKFLPNTAILCQRDLSILNYPFLLSLKKKQKLKIKKIGSDMNEF